MNSVLMSTVQVPEFMLYPHWQRMPWSHLGKAFAEERAAWQLFDSTTVILPQPMVAMVDFIDAFLLTYSDFRQYDHVTPERWETREELERFQDVHRELFDATRLRTASFDELQLLITWINNEEKRNFDIRFQSFTNGVLDALCLRMGEIAQTQKEFFVSRHP